MRVHLTSIITSKDVDLGLIDEADDLDVIGSLGVLNTLEGTSGDETSSVTGLGAPSDHDTFDVANFPTHLGGTPQAKV